MSKWIDVHSSDEGDEEEYQNEGDEMEEKEEESEEGKERDKESVRSNSNSEEEIYKETKGTDDNGKDVDYSNYKPNQRELNEFSSLLSTIKNQIDDIDIKLSSMVKNLDSDKIEIKYGLSYYESKQNIFLMYLTELIAYLILKSNANESINKHPLLKSIQHLSQIIDKSKVIDMKLKTQIERLISLAENKSENEANFKPRVLNEERNEFDNSSNETNTEEEENQKKIQKEKEKEKYKVKQSVIEFFETKDDKRERKRQIEKDKDRIRNSEHIKNLREEMSDKPHVVNSYTSHVDRYNKMLEEYNDEYFQTIKMTKNERKRLRKKDIKEDDLANLDKELKQMTNVLLHSNEDDHNRQNEAKMFIQRKREMQKIQNASIKTNKKFNKKKK